MLRNAFVYKIQRELLCPESDRNVSGLSSDAPQLQGFRGQRTRRYFGSGFKVTGGGGASEAPIPVPERSKSPVLIGLMFTNTNVVTGSPDALYVELIYK